MYDWNQLIMSCARHVFGLCGVTLTCGGTLQLSSHTTREVVFMCYDPGSIRLIFSMMWQFAGDYIFSSLWANKAVTVPKYSCASSGYERLGSKSMISE